ncbi:hypothetical protein [Ramlibacter sp. AN1133]|uniref:hypothetical protein n=1 Tax=Ramlibacter sp. AN1133 TaxID=3133429 RepID=UPI0030C52A32
MNFQSALRRATRHAFGLQALALLTPGAFAMGPQPCGAGSMPSGQHLKVTGSDILLRASPGPKGERMINEKATAALHEKQYLTIDNSVRVVQQCTQGAWSRVQVESPEWLRDSHIGWVPTSVLRSQKNDTSGKELFTEADFGWDQFTRDYKAIIIAGVNKLARENSACKAIDPATASRSTTKGSKADPVFWVTCGTGNAARNIFFTKSDVENNRVLSHSRY